jgi:ribosomal protein S11
MIQAANLTNSNISFNNITTTAYIARGIYLSTNSTSNNLTSNNITTSGYSSYGIILSTSSNNTLTSNNITTSNSYAYGIILSINSTSNNLTSNNITTTNTSSAYGIYFYSSNANNVSNTNITTPASGTSKDIYIYGANLYRNYIINSTFNQSDVGFDSGATDSIEVQWYLDVYVNNTLGSPINQANVTGWNVTGIQKFSELTASNGYIATKTLTEYTQNRTNKYYQTNYTVNATKSGYATPSKQVNLTSSRTEVFTISDVTPPIYSNNGANETSINAGDAVLIYSRWLDGTALDWAWLSTNETGVWRNYTQSNIFILSKSASQKNFTSGRTSNLTCQWASSAVATEESSDRLAAWATGAPDCTVDCDATFQGTCAWAKTAWSNIAHINLTYSTPVYATNVSVTYDSNPTINELDLLKPDGSWDVIYSGSNNTCPFNKAFGSKNYSTNKVRVYSNDNDWCVVDAVQLCGYDNMPENNYTDIAVNNVNAGTKYILFLSDDTQTSWMVNPAKNASGYLISQGIGQVQNIITGNGSAAAPYWYNDATLRAFVNASYTNSTYEIGFHGLNHANDELNIPAPNVSAKISQGFTAIRNGLYGVYYDLNITVAPGCTHNTSALSAYQDNNITIAGSGFYNWAPGWGHEKEEPITNVTWIPVNLVMMMNDAGTDMRSATDIENDCFGKIQQFGFCSIYFHVQNFQDPVNDTRYQILKDVVNWIKTNTTLQNWGVVYNKTASQILADWDKSYLYIENYDDYYRDNNINESIVASGNSANFTNFQLFNASDTISKNYNISYKKFFGVSNVNLTFMVGQPLTNANDTGYILSKILLKVGDNTYDSPIFLNESNSWTWSNFTWKNSSITSGSMGWKIYANDSFGNENVTELTYLTLSEVQTISVTLSTTLSSGILFGTVAPNTSGNPAQNNTNCAGGGTCYNFTVISTSNVSFYNKLTSTITCTGGTCAFYVSGSDNNSNSGFSGNSTFDTNYVGIENCNAIANGNNCWIRHFVDVSSGVISSNYGDNSKYTWCANATVGYTPC